MASGPHITFSSCHASGFSSVKWGHASLPAHGYLARPPAGSRLALSLCQGP